jgi:hypothetical protein
VGCCLRGAVRLVPSRPRPFKQVSRTVLRANCVSPSDAGRINSDLAKGSYKPDARPQRALPPTALDNLENAPAGTRTRDARISCPKLYPLSYGGVEERQPGLGAALPATACSRPGSGLSATHAGHDGMRSLTLKGAPDGQPVAVGPGMASGGKRSTSSAWSGRHGLPRRRAFWGYSRAALDGAGSAVDQRPELRGVVVAVVVAPDVLVATVASSR